MDMLVTRGASGTLPVYMGNHRLTCIITLSNLTGRWVPMGGHLTSCAEVPLPSIPL